MLIPHSSVGSLLLFFGPLLLPKTIAYYRSVRNGPHRQGLAVVPTPRGISYAMMILFMAALLLLVFTLPAASPENIFSRTKSRALVPVDVLFTRLAALRARGTLSPRDELLRARLVPADARLIYFHLGPDPLTDCPYCLPDDPRSYLYYALPALVVPHLANLATLALATSPILSPRHGPRWRTLVTITAAAAAAADIWLVSAHTPSANAPSGRPDTFFWSMRLYRLLGLAGLDALVGWLLYLSSTNRAFVLVEQPSARVEAATAQLAAARARLHAVCVVKNTAARDPDLRARALAYWVHEVRLMAEAMEDRPVVDAVNDALVARVDIRSLTRDADGYASLLLNSSRPQVDAPSEPR